MKKRTAIPAISALMAVQTISIPGVAQSHHEYTLAAVSRHATFFVDLPSIENEGPYLIGWTLVVNYPDKQALKGAYTYQLARQKTLCTDKSSVITDLVRYTESGEVVESASNNPLPLEHVAPDSFGESVLETICSGKSVIGNAVTAVTLNGAVAAARAAMAKMGN
jgi:hypothetical protein